MKCVKKDDKYERVSDFRAHVLVTEEGWKYCSKSEWRKAVARD